MVSDQLITHKLLKDTPPAAYTSTVLALPLPQQLRQQSQTPFILVFLSFLFLMCFLMSM